MLSQARETAIERMMQLAEENDADVIVGVRITTASIMELVAGMLAYGTAVRLRKK